jgi:hypothetical protein
VSEQAQLSKTIEVLNSRLAILQGLKQHPGMALFEEMVTPLANFALRKAYDAKEGIDMAKWMGRAQTAHEISTWIDREIHETKIQLQHALESRANQ